MVPSTLQSIRGSSWCAGQIIIIIINKGLPTDFCQLTMLIGELACSAVHNTTLLTKFDIKYKMFLKQNFLENNVLSTELSSSTN